MPASSLRALDGKRSSEVTGERLPTCSIVAAQLFPEEPQSEYAR